MWRMQRQRGLQAPEQIQAAELTPLETAIVILVEELIQVLLVFTAAWLYIRYKPDPLIALEEAAKEDSLDGKFKHSLFACCQNPGVSLFTCFCEGIRWADSMRLVGLQSFSSAIITWLTINCVCILLGEGGFGHPLLAMAALAMVLTYYRQGLRDKFRMASNWGTVSLDCLSYAFCAPCALVQDARQLEEAKLLGHAAVKNSFPLAFGGADPRSPEAMSP